MELKQHHTAHLTYCSNIHPGESWNDHFNQIKTYLPELKKRLSPDRPFGTGLRLSAKAAEELKKPEQLEAFKRWLSEENLYLFTMNGFPYGSFHGEKVKDNVYKPDWTTTDRLNYTLNLISILSDLLPAGTDGGISTSPVSYKYWFDDDESRQEVIKNALPNVAEAARRMRKVKEETGKTIHLDIEPEPDCILENVNETVRFFTDSLFPVGGRYLSDRYSYSADVAADLLCDHIRLCYDTCHFALEYEDPSVAIQSIKDAGVKIGKTQVSSALKVEWTNTESSAEEIKQKLKNFDEPVYLHQVIELRKDGSFYQYRDLPDALERMDSAAAKEWRIHFHVPVFVDTYGGLKSTQDHIREALPLLLDKTGCNHYEIETYTWDVLPEGLKADLADSIEREYRWTIDRIDELKQKEL